MMSDARGSKPSFQASAWARLILALPRSAKLRLAGRRGFPQYLLWFAGRRVRLNMRVADIGSGEGGMVSRLARHGFSDVWGFDPFIAGDRDDGNAHYRKRSLSEKDGPLDIILFNHSLEHVPEPVQALRDASGALADDGAIIVRIPIARSYADRRFGPHWVALDAPRHLAIPSASGMAVAAHAAGLRLERTFYDSQPLQFWGSQNYQRGVSLLNQPRLPPTQERRLRAHAEDLNRAQDGDNAGFVLTRLPS